MRKIILSLILAVIMQVAFAQTEFAPIGATWYYSLADYTIPYPYTFIKYMKIVSTADTVIYGKACRILSEYRTPTNNLDSNLNFSGKHFVCSENDKVYYYDTTTESFDILYDFSKIEQEYWLSYLWGNSPFCDTVKVESVGDTLLNGHLLRVLNVSQNSCLAGFFFNDYPIIEVIGHLHFLFPQADFPSEGPLRCYEDNVIGLYNTGIVPYCDYIGTANLNELTEVQKIDVFPNPFIDVLYINLSNFSTEVDVKIFDIIGHCIYEKTYYKNVKPIEINLLNTKAGIYILSINENHLIIVKNDK